MSANYTIYINFYCPHTQLAGRQCFSHVCSPVQLGGRWVWGLTASYDRDPFSPVPLHQGPVPPPGERVVGPRLKYFLVTCSIMFALNENCLKCEGRPIMYIQQIKWTNYMSWEGECNTLTIVHTTCYILWQYTFPQGCLSPANIKFPVFSLCSQPLFSFFFVLFCFRFIPLLFLRDIPLVIHSKLQSQ